MVKSSCNSLQKTEPTIYFSAAFELIFKINKPVTADNEEPIRILSFEAVTVSASSKARLLMNMDIVNPIDRKSTRLNSSHPRLSRMPSSA